MPAFVGFAARPARQAEVATAVVMVGAGCLLGALVAIINLPAALFAIYGAAIGLLAGWLGGTVHSHRIGTALRTQARAERSLRDRNTSLSLVTIVLLLVVGLFVLLVLPQSPLTAGVVLALVVALAMDAGATAALIARGLRAFEVESGVKVWVTAVGTRWVYSLAPPPGVGGGKL